MASTTPLPTLLQSLNIGVSSAEHGKEEEGGVHPAPRLALVDQLHLLSAHIDTLEKSIQKTVSSEQDRATISKHIKGATQVQARVDAVRTRVQELEKREISEDNDDEAILENLSAYITAKIAVEKQRKLHEVGTLLRDAVQAVEQLEHRLDACDLHSESLAKSIREAELKFAGLGIGSSVSNSKEGAAAILRSVSQSGGSSPLAIRELGGRLEVAKEKAKQLLFDSWGSCVRIQSNETSMAVSILDNANASTLTLAEVMQTLQSRSELQALLEQLAKIILATVTQPLLDVRQAWTSSENGNNDWHINRKEGVESPTETVTALGSLLELLQRKIFSVAPSSSQANYVFGRIFLPALVPATLKKLKSCLPTRLEQPLSLHTLPTLALLSQLATDIHDTLLREDYLQEDLQNEAEELLDWADNIEKHFMKGLATSLRKRARKLVLQDTGGGWHAVPTQFEVEPEILQARKLLEDGAGRSDQTSKIVASTRANVVEEEEAWSAWNEDEALEGISSISRSTSTSSTKPRQKKANLGVKRVVMPKDQLGSGPLPEDEHGDDVSWGFDEPLDMTTRGAGPSDAIGPSQMQYDSLIKVTDEEEDVDEDAWGLTEEEKEERAAKRASMRGDMAAAFQAFQTQQQKHASNLGQIEDAADVPAEVDEDDMEDAWGLSAQEKEALENKRRSRISGMGISPMPDVKSQPQSTSEHAEDEGAEDAWGLSAAEDDASAQEISTSTPTSPQNTMMVARSNGDTALTHDKSRASSSSFTGTAKLLEMNSEEKGYNTTISSSRGEGDAANQIWDSREDVLSGSEGAPTGHSTEGKSSGSGSGEKLSDTTTDPWEEISAPPSVHSLQSYSQAPPLCSNTDWNSSDGEGPRGLAHPAAAIGGSVAALASTAATSTAVGRTSSPAQRTSSPTAGTSGKRTASPQIGRASTDSAPSVVRKPSRSRGGPESSSKSSPPAETCTISQRSVQLIDLINEVLDSIHIIVQSDFGNGRLDASYLVSSINDILDMHRALLPVGHADTLATVPSLAMQFVNDCRFIGRELKKMQIKWSDLKGTLSEDKALDFDLQAQLSFSLGKRSFDAQMLLQQKALFDCLIDANGFTGTYDEDRYQGCQRSLKQVDFVFKQLHSAWKPVLTRPSFLAAMGRLLDGVLRRVLLDIEAIEDISEVESEKLASLLKSLGNLEHLFREESQPSEESVVALFVPSWFKASYLAEILTGSLVDIEFLYFEAGALVDYSKMELISLIRSLFADTPKRARLIERIQSSPGT